MKPPLVCAHCIHRHGDLCTHPASPVNRPPRRTLWDWLDDYMGFHWLRMPDSYYYQRGECGPVCIGKVKDLTGFQNLSGLLPPPTSKLLHSPIPLLTT